MTSLEYLNPTESYLVLLGLYRGLMSGGSGGGDAGVGDEDLLAVVDIGGGKYMFFDSSFGPVLEFLSVPRRTSEVLSMPQTQPNSFFLSVVDVLLDARLVGVLGDPDRGMQLRQMEGIAFSGVVEEQDFEPSVEFLPEVLRDVFFSAAGEDIPSILGRHFSDPESFVEQTQQAVAEALRSGSGFLFRVPTESGFQFGGVMSCPAGYESVENEDFSVVVGRCISVSGDAGGDPVVLISHGGEIISYPAATEEAFRYLSVPRKADDVPAWFEKNYPYDPFEFVAAVFDYGVVRDFTFEGSFEELVNQFDGVVFVPTVFILDEKESGVFDIVPLPPARELPENLLNVPACLKGFFEPLDGDSVLDIPDVLVREAKRNGMSTQELFDVFLSLLPYALSSCCGYLEKASGGEHGG